MIGKNSITIPEIILISMKNYFYFTKGQKRGILLFLFAVLIVILIRWCI